MLLSERRSKNTLLFRLLICLGLAGLTMLLHQLPALQSLENRLYDARVRLLASEQVPSEDIIVLAIDDESLQRMEPAVGRWPWPRAIYAGILDYCQQADCVVMDIILSESDQLFSRSDREYIDAAKKHGKLVSALYLDNLNTAEEKLKNIHPFALPVKLPKNLQILQREGALIPFADALEASLLLGHTNYRSDSDGVVREYAVLAQVNNNVFPSLALAAAMAKLNLKPEALQLKQQTIEAGELNIPINGKAGFHFFPSSETYPVYNIVDVLMSWQAENSGGQPIIPRNAFKGKVVFIGSLATGLQMDRKVTPIDSRTPGVFIHATALDNILNNNYYHWPHTPLVLLLILLLTLAPALPQVERPWIMLFYGMACIVAYGLIVLFYLQHKQLVLPVAGPIFGLLAAIFTLGALNWGRERIQRSKLEEMEKSKQQFTDMLVHDMKGRISSIVMSMALIDQQTDSENEKQHRLINTLKASSDRLLAQINALLDIRKIEEGKMPLNKRPVSVHDLLNESIREFTPSAEIIGLRFDADFDPQLTQPLDIDPAIFQRIIGNLVWNALQYAEKGTAVLVKTQKATQELVITIANHGPQINPEQRELLFKSYSSITDSDNFKNVKTVSNRPRARFLSPRH